MSEFKFACPVCGQHMKCEASHGGSVMECPTCFQKIVAPQAPSADGKFILTGTKYSEKKISVRGVDPASASVVPEKEFPLKLFIIALVLCLAGAAAIFFFHINKPVPPKPSPKTVLPINTAATPKPEVVTPPKPKPPPGPPHASDTNWTLNLDEVVTPSRTVAGRIHGQDCLLERVWFQSGILNLRTSTNVPVELGLQINFSGAAPEVLTNKTITVTADVEKAAVVTLLWKDDGAAQKQIFNAGYAMRLEFDAIVKGKLTGKMYLCTPDPEKSYLMGKFYANIVKPKPKPPTKPVPAKTTNSPVKKP